MTKNNSNKDFLIEYAENKKIYDEFNILDIYGYYIPKAYDINQYIYIIMEIIDDDLFSFIQKKKNVTIKEKYEFIRNAALLVEKFHLQNIIHGDIRTSNFFVLPDKKTLKLQLTYVNKQQSVSFIGNTSSSVRYLAPELLNLFVYPRKESDIYALGCVFYEILTGHLGYYGNNLNSNIEMHIFKGFTPKKYEIEYNKGKMIPKLKGFNSLLDMCWRKKDERATIKEVVKWFYDNEF